MPRHSLFPRYCSQQRTLRLCRAQEGLDAILNKIGGPEAAEARLLNKLWKEWEYVMGEELAGMAFPLGRRKKALIVGGEDNLVLQELAFQKSEILERANAFMGSNFFEKVELSLAMGRPDLTKPPNITPSERPQPRLAPPENLSAGLNIDPDSPVGKFYAACLKRFELQ